MFERSEINQNNVFYRSAGLPYLRVTGKWTVPNKTRKFPTSGIISFFLLVLFTVNTFLFQSFHRQYRDCLQTVTKLENMVKHLKEETQDLKEKLNSLRQSNAPSTSPFFSAFLPENELSSVSGARKSVDSQSELIRIKRSNDEIRSDRKERKKSKS